MNPRVTAIYIYPIKSLAGISVPSVSFCQTGLSHDRRWMLVDRNNRFITQREFKQLCLFKVELVTNQLLVSYEGDAISIPLTIDTGDSTIVSIWDCSVECLRAAEVINKWFSSKLEHDVSLVYMPNDTVRTINPNHIVNNEQVSFADGYPLLIIGEGSVRELQSKLKEPISFDRFRPNLVVSSVIAHEEDTWQHFTINQLTYRGIKPCKRCSVITINQQSAKTSAEPLKTLATYRQFDHHILFGLNVAPPVKGTVSVGDTIEVTDYFPQ
jgi:uncharacterized protein YcbX